MALIIDNVQVKSKPKAAAKLPENYAPHPMAQTWTREQA